MGPEMEPKWGPEMEPKRGPLSGSIPGPEPGPVIDPVLIYIVVVGLDKVHPSASRNQPQTAIRLPAKPYNSEFPVQLEGGDFILEISDPLNPAKTYS